MLLKVFVQAASLQAIHRAQVTGAADDPAGAFVCKQVEFPNDGGEPPDALLQASQLAKAAKPGDTIVLDPGQCLRSGRKPVLGSFRGRRAGKTVRVCYLARIIASGAEG